MRTALRTSAVLFTAALMLSACGNSESSEPSGSDEDGFPVTITDERGEVTLDSEPSRVVSLSPSNTEMLFAIGADDQVVAADEYSNYPEEAPDTDLSGLTPSVEAIVGHDPDLVLLPEDSADAADELEAVDVPAIVLPAGESVQETYDQMRLLGEATGNVDDANEAADRVEEDFDTIVADTKEQLGGDVDLSVYHELDDAMYSVTSATFIGEVYEKFGLDNIADEAEDSADYPQLSSEFVVDANPDLVFLAYGDDDAVDALADRPAFDTVSAVEDDNVIVLDPDISSRWGPRVVDLAEDVSEALLAIES